MVKKTDTVVNHNHVEMDGPMMQLLKTESIGGNAGRVKLGGETTRARPPTGTPILRPGGSCL